MVGGRGAITRRPGRRHKTRTNLPDESRKETDLMLLQGRKALIIGGGNGLGRAIACAYRREGATLAVADLDHAAALATLTQVEQVEQTGPSAQGLALQVDVADAEASRQVIEKAAVQLGRL